ncbi:MAG: hypothetical protein K6V97_15480 [Actinomycetia bacterium]|nr:hypothetical protein [Actinomycetes bacterium]
MPSTTAASSVSPRRLPKRFYRRVESGGRRAGLPTRRGCPPCLSPLPWGRGVPAHVAEDLPRTCSVLSNGRRKLESAGVLETVSPGQKGTRIRIGNPCLRPLLAGLAQHTLEAGGAPDHRPRPARQRRRRVVDTLPLSSAA